MLTPRKMSFFTGFLLLVHFLTIAFWQFFFNRTFFNHHVFHISRHICHSRQFILNSILINISFINSLLQLIPFYFREANFSFVITCIWTTSCIHFNHLCKSFFLLIHLLSGFFIGRTIFNPLLWLHLLAHVFS